MPHYFGSDCGMLEFLKYYTQEPSSREQLLAVWMSTDNPSAEEVGGF